MGIQVRDLTASSLYLKQTHTLGLHMRRVSLTQAICIYMFPVWDLLCMETGCSWLHFNQSSHACVWTRHKQILYFFDFFPPLNWSHTTHASGAKQNLPYPRIVPALHTWAAGNMRALDKLFYLQWVKLGTPSPQKWSTPSSGISVETDGTKDGLVPCINLEVWQLMPQKRSQPRQPRSLLANNAAQYCM